MTTWCVVRVLRHFDDTGRAVVGIAEANDPARVVRNVTISAADMAADVAAQRAIADAVAEADRALGELALQQITNVLPLTTIPTLTGLVGQPAPDA